MFVEGHFCSILLYTRATADEDSDNSKQGGKKMQHILQETVLHLVHFCLCLCLCVFYCACGNGSTGQDHRNPRTDRITTSTKAGQFRSVTFHIMIRYHRCMTNHHFWHCGCINCLHTTSSITPAGQS